MFNISDYIKYLGKGEKDLSRGNNVLFSGCCDTAGLFIVSHISEKLGRPVLLVCGNEEEADRIFDNLSHFLPEEKLLFFPYTELYRESAPDIGRIGEKLVTLNSFSDQVAVVPVQALTEKLMPKKALEKSVVSLQVGDTLEIDDFEEKLVALGYSKGDVCDRKGIYSKRGSLMDVFPSNEEMPVRINLDWDEIGEIKYFDTETQRSADTLYACEIYPAREVLYGTAPDPREKIRAVLKKELEKKEEWADLLKENTENALEKIREKIYFEGLEFFLPFFYEETYIWDYLPENTIVLYLNPETGAKSLEDFREKSLATLMRDRRKGCLTDKEFYPYNLDGDICCPKKFTWGCICNFEPGEELKGFSDCIKYEINSQKAPSFADKFNSLVAYLGALSKKEKVIFATASPFRTEQILRDYDIEALIVDTDAEIIGLDYKIFVTHAPISEGVFFPDASVTVLSDSEVFGIKRGKKVRRLQNSSNTVKSYLDLKKKDYVVHEDYGICRYLGSERKQVMGVWNDFLVLEFANQTLYISSNSVDKIQKYISGDSLAPKLSRIGGTNWEKTKTRAKKKIYEIAKELVDLYAYRQHAKGISYDGGGKWEEELEKSFPYIETRSQARTIREIKEDLASPRPMDRLVCGDVGFGKTEVAIRAAFRVACSGRQVAVLVPTTVLSEQHYNSFRERLAPFPIKVELLNRFRSAKETKEITERVKTGKTDIIIGTHKLFSKNLAFANLGLIIIDEEQRFGVKHKEKLKEMKKNADVLSLSATPIPRTLNMSLSGIRDISYITDPPEGRMPIKTFVKPYDIHLVKNAIKDELARGGQVFYVHNRVEDINRVADVIEGLVPEAVVDIGHGQMREGDLEDVMMDFYQGVVNVLVATTIIENGIDVSNANTIIIDNADKLGMAQLYQLRGRVGRSGRQAYAYLLYSDNMTETAEERLSALKEFSALGSGFRIAEKDLEIRGSGNLLGKEQSGNIEGIGFEYYCRLLEEAVEKLKGNVTETEEDTLPSADLNIDVYIPEDYIREENIRIMFYKKIAAARNVSAYEDIKAEMKDRFGKLPKPCENLLDILHIKLLAKENHIEAISRFQDRYVMVFAKGIVIPEDVTERLNRTLEDMTLACDRLFYYGDKDNAVERTLEVMTRLPDIFRQAQNRIL